MMEEDFDKEKMFEEYFDAFLLDLENYKVQEEKVTYDEIKKK